MLCCTCILLLTVHHAHLFHATLYMSANVHDFTSRSKHCRDMELCFSMQWRYNHRNTLWQMVPKIWENLKHETLQLRMRRVAKTPSSLSGGGSKNKSIRIGMIFQFIYRIQFKPQTSGLKLWFNTSAFFPTGSKVMDLVGIGMEFDFGVETVPCHWSGVFMITSCFAWWVA